MDSETTGRDNAIVLDTDSFQKALEEMCRTSLGMVNVIDK